MDQLQRHPAHSSQTWSIAEFDASPLWTSGPSTTPTGATSSATSSTTPTPSTPPPPVGFVGGQAPNAFGGYDYATPHAQDPVHRSLQPRLIQAVIRSFNPHNAIPAVTTHFHRNVDDTIWQVLVLPRPRQPRLHRLGRELVRRQNPQALPRSDRPDAHGSRENSPPCSPAQPGSTTASRSTTPSPRSSSAGSSTPRPTARPGSTATTTTASAQHQRPPRLGKHAARLKACSTTSSATSTSSRKASPRNTRSLILPACLCLSDAEAARLRDFVQSGGTVIADYLPGLWDQHGVGRTPVASSTTSSASTTTPHLKAADVFGRKLWVETRPGRQLHLENLRDFLTNENTCIKDAIRLRQSRPQHAHRPRQPLRQGHRRPA